MADSLLTPASALTSSTINPSGDPSAAPTTTDPAKLKDLASQFEGLLLSQMMRDLKMSFGGGEEEEGSDSQAIAPLGDQMLSELGLALSRAGGFGLGDVLARSMAEKTSGIAPSGIGSSDSAPSDIGSSNIAPSSALSSALSSAPSSAPPSVPLVPSVPSSAPRVSSPFGLRSDPINGETRFHKGIDIAVREGSTVYAPAAGKVVSVGEQSGYGLTVVVQHANGYQSRYAHLSSANVQVGQTVAAGDVLAKSGNTGRSTGAHLHLEVLENGQALNPENWVDSVVRDQR
jgi:Rod binding domain-containing protein